MKCESANVWWRFVGFGFRLLYNEMAFTYDWVSKAVSLGQWSCWQQTALHYLPSPTATDIVLEIAHGTGDLQTTLQAAGYRTLGYDLSPYMGRITQRKLRRAGQRADLARGMALRLPYADASIAALVSTFPTSFVTEPQSLREAYRVLKPGGRYVVVLNGVLTGNGAIKRFLEWLYRITGQREAADVDLATYFADVGFHISAHQEACPHSTAQLVVFHKSADSH